ncbi:ATP-binding protein [Puniceicoccus vermicola]|uniref:histidine kinase n=1 Tax=Puniceicoccus vermicola TaxID=388746 RepID=A0A7X1AYV1_9BACT|nr:ATP-binding protein [Puniceicoccus vermicola]MBC2602501.1 response regulator [Puniceicoccus vermicola]
MNGQHKGSYKSIRLLEKTLEVSNSSIVFTDARGNITYVNPAFVERTGYSVDEVLGKNPRILKSGRIDKSIYENLWKTISAGGTWSGQMQNKAKDGTLFWEQATIFPVFDREREISQYVAIKEDITAQKRTETILRCVGTANQLLLQSPNLEIAIPQILELLGQACDVDRAYLFQYSEPISDPKQARISLKSEWNSGAFAPQIDNPELQDLSTNQGLMKEWIASLVDGNPIRVNVAELPEPEYSLMQSQDIVSLLLIPVHVGRRLFGLIGFDDCQIERDWPDQEISLLLSVSGSLGIVLQKKEYEHDIQEALIKAETSAMEAIQANSAKSAFLATMSHEIRTPLNGILGMTQIMLEEETSEEKRDFLETIHKSGENLYGLLNDILDFSKIEAGKLEIVCRIFSIRSIASEVRNLFVGTAREAGLELLLDCPDDLSERVYGDPDRVRQVLVNLVSNALKFTEKGKIEIRVMSVEQERKFIQVQVEDTGIGIRPELQGTLFEMFTQGDSSTTRRFGGTGLGLAISRRLMEAMGGRIWFESTPFVGSRFFFEFPAELPDKEMNKDQETLPNFELPKLKIPDRPEPPRNLKILIVEDNPVNQRVAELQLRSLGQDCESDDNGRQAIRRFEKGETFDIVFMDCQMAGINGFEATEQILSIAEKPPYIVALTASSATVDRERSVNVGMKEYIVKPVNKEKLAGVIERFQKESK